jgi:hypothetical protein
MGTVASVLAMTGGAALVPATALGAAIGLGLVALLTYEEIRSRRVTERIGGYITRITE